MRRVLVCGIVLLSATLACGPFGGTDEGAVQTAIAQTEVADSEIQAAVETVVAETALAATDTPPPTETPELTPTPTPPPEPVYIRSHAEVSNDELRYVIGEVANDGTVDIQFVKILADFYDASGNPAGSDFTYTSLSVIPAGGRSPFSMATHVREDVSPDWASYELRLESQEVTGDCYMCYAEFEMVEEALTHPGGRVGVEGVLRNTGPSDAQRVQITVTYYDEADNVIGMGFTFADEDIVPAGGTSSFRVLLYTGLPVEIDHYTLYVMGTGL